MKRTRPISLFALLAGALIALGAWTQDWFVVGISEGAAVNRVSIAGSVAAPLISSTAMGVLAGLTVILIGQHVMRLVVSVIVIVLVAVGIGSVVTAVNDPVVASSSELSRVTGVADSSALAQQVSDISTSAWPGICIAGLALVALGAVVALGFSVNWKSSSRRYTRPESGTKKTQHAPAEVHDGDSWDSLTKGTDPTR